MKIKVFCVFLFARHSKVGLPRGANRNEFVFHHFQLREKFKSRDKEALISKTLFKFSFKSSLSLRESGIVHPAFHLNKNDKTNLKAQSHDLSLTYAAVAESYVAAEIGKFPIFATHDSTAATGINAARVNQWTTAPCN